MSSMLLAVGSVEGDALKAIREVGGTVTTVASPLLPDECLPSLALVTLPYEKFIARWLYQGVYDLTLIVCDTDSEAVEVYLRLKMEQNVCDSIITYIDRVSFKKPTRHTTEEVA